MVPHGLGMLAAAQQRQALRLHVDPLAVAVAAIGGLPLLGADAALDACAPAAAQVALRGLGVAAEELGPQPLGVLHLVAVAVAVHLRHRNADLGDQAAALGGLDHRVVAQVADDCDALVAAAHLSPPSTLLLQKVR